MKVDSLQIKDFRNYQSLNVKFDDKVNVFIGKNAQGKTNLLESIYFCCLGKSFKAAKDKYLECLNVNAGDYRSRYMCELCDVNISLDNDSLAGLADATKRYIGSWTLDKTADKYNMIPQSLSLGSVLNPKSSVPAALKQ